MEVTVRKELYDNQRKEYRLVKNIRTTLEIWQKHLQIHTPIQQFYRYSITGTDPIESNNLGVIHTVHSSLFD